MSVPWKEIITVTSPSVTIQGENYFLLPVDFLENVFCEVEKDLTSNVKPTARNDIKREKQLMLLRVMKTEIPKRNLFMFKDEIHLAVSALEFKWLKKQYEESELPF
jgi:hypothetical protein